MLYSLGSLHPLQCIVKISGAAADAFGDLPEKKAVFPFKDIYDIGGLPIMVDPPNHNLQYSKGHPRGRTRHDPMCQLATRDSVIESVTQVTQSQKN